MNAADPFRVANRGVSGPTVAFGPVAGGWGSWDWVGADVARELGRDLVTSTFEAWEVPDADVVFVVKHPPPPGWIERASRRSAAVYAPVDRYGSAAEIDADAPFLRRCARVLVHCERLRRYVAPYAVAEYMDHHVKFVAPLREEFLGEGEILWTGVRTNLPPLVAWANTNGLPATLRILTNPEDPNRVPGPAELGFRRSLNVTVEAWTPALHAERLAMARGVLDVKDDDFRSRHKPPAKAIDAVASGVPTAIDPSGSAGEHLARLGFEVCPPEDADRWFSREYWDDSRRFGAALREMLSLERVGRRYRRIIRQLS